MYKRFSIPFVFFCLLCSATSSRAQTYGGGAVIDPAADSTVTTGTLADATLNGTAIRVVESGGTRGTRSVDLQSTRSATARVASGNYSVIGGGSENTASGTFSTVPGGSQNTASGFYATALGGLYNKATGNFSLAAGRRSVASAAGSWMFSDDTNSTKTNSLASSLAFDFAGGYVFRSGTTTFSATVVFVDLDAESYSLDGVTWVDGGTYVDYDDAGLSGHRFIGPVYLTSDLTVTTGTVSAEQLTSTDDADVANDLTAGTVLSDTTLGTVAGAVTATYIGGPQLNLVYDATHYTTFTVDAFGRLDIAPSGGDIDIAADIDVAGEIDGEHVDIRPAVGTDFVVIKTENDGGEFGFGINNSAGAGFVSGAGVYGGVIERQGVYPISIWTNATKRVNIAGAGGVDIVDALTAGSIASDAGVTAVTTIQGEQLTSTDDAFIADDLSVGGDLVVGGDVDFTGNFSTTATITGE